MAVDEVELAAISKIAIVNFDNRLAGIGQLKQQAALDVLKFAAGDLILIGLLVVREGEQVMFAGEVLRQEFVDEADIVVDAPDFKHLLPS